MTKILRDIWIMKDGMVIFQRVFNKNMDNQLFGGFMSALNSFAAEIDSEGLSNFEIGNNKFYIKKSENLIFIANANTDAKSKNVNKELNNITSKFLKEYPKEMIDNWNGDLSFFDDFEGTISESIETAYEKLKESFW